MPAIGKKAIILDINLFDPGLKMTLKLLNVLYILYVPYDLVSVLCILLTKQYG
jgi:hypothetical protein